MPITYTPVLTGPDYFLIVNLKPTLNVYVLLQTSVGGRGPYLVAPSLKRIKRAYRQAPGVNLAVYFFTKGLVYQVTQFIRVKV